MTRMLIAALTRRATTAMVAAPTRRMTTRWSARRGSATGTLDKYMFTLNMHYTSWKYWHAAMLHYKKMVIVMAFDIYTRVATGKAGDKYKVDMPLGFARACRHR